MVGVEQGSPNIYEDLSSADAQEMSMLAYPVTLTPDDGTILVTFVDVPEAITFGSDEDEALLQAVDALESALAFYVADRKPLPKPSKPKRGQKTVSPADMSSKLTVNRLNI